MVPKGGNFHNELRVPPPSTFSSFLHLSVLMCMCTQHDSSNSIPYRGLFSLGFNFRYVAKINFAKSFLQYKFNGKTLPKCENKNL